MNEVLKYKTWKDRINLLKAMHELMKALNNEDGYYEWIETMPDEPTVEDFQDIAEDNALYGECCREFRRIMALYGDDGFYVFDDAEAF